MSGFKLLLAGAVLGLMAVFAFIGVKSLVDGQNTSLSQQVDQQLQSSVQTPPATQVEGTEPAMADQGLPQTADSDTTQLTPETADEQQQTQTPPASATQNQQQQTTAAQTSVADEQQAAATQSTEEEEKLDMQLIDEYGGLQLTLSDPAAPGTPVKGQFVIRDAQDQVVANINDADTASFDLSPGYYEVTVIAQGKKSARMVRIVTGEFVTENFVLPSAEPQPVVQQATQPAQQQAASAGTGRLSVRVQAATTKAPLKSNIYVQLPNGQNVAKENYAEAAEFVLRPGDYKVTVKAQGKVDIVRNIGIRANGNVQQVFEMQSPAAQAPVQPAPPAEGTLRMALRAPAGQNLSNGRFVVTDAQGNRVKRMRGVSNAEVKLQPGRYEVTAVHMGSRLSRQIDVAQGKTSNITFNIDDFPRNPVNQAQNQNAPARPPVQQQVEVPAQQGILQLIAVSGVTGQPLKVNFNVSTLNGQRLKAANDVSVTEVTLPPQDVLVDISYEDMRGQERIQVKAGEPTVFTFTITPNSANNTAPIPQAQPEAPRSLEEMLIERLQQEIFNRMN
ncbi:MAG: hypothetical protein R3F02_03850 [Thiolinea sp.]